MATVQGSAQFWCPLLVILAIVVLPLLQSCASPERLPPVPSADTAKALPLGLANARFFPLVERAGMIAEWEQALQRQRQVLGLAPDAQLPDRTTFSPFPAAATTARSVPAFWSAGPKPAIAPSFRS